MNTPLNTVNGSALKRWPRDYCRLVVRAAYRNKAKAVCASIASALCLMSLTSTVLLASEPAVVIGGGYKLSGSQGQIELNVKWVQQVLNRSGMSVHTYFTDGDDPGVDVYSVASSRNRGDSDDWQLEALARVFGDVDSALTRHYNNSVPDLQGSTRDSELLPAVSNILGDTDTDGLPGLLVFNGHGGPSSSDPDQVTLKLWDDTRVTARQLHGLLEESSADLRFVFTQCYSGGFHRLAYENSQNGLGLSAATRCGFTAESAWRLAEGCSASVDTEDYRDYTTFFFAALDGKTRDGKPLNGSPDFDRDGVVSLRDAHLYTLEHAHSTDLSRSSSEDYLSNWQPLLDRWMPVRKELPDNEYARLVSALTKRLAFTTSNPAATEIRSRLQQHESQLHKAAAEAYELEADTKVLSRKIQQSALGIWPALNSPYSDGYASLAAAGRLSEVNTWLAAHDEYPQLRENQLRINELTNLMLIAERDATQMRKLLRLRKMSRLKADLYHKGSRDEIDGYEQLLACENLPLSGAADKSAAVQDSGATN